MTYLLAGILLWSVVHFIPAAAPGLRARCAKRLGEYGFKGLFTLLIVAAIGFMIVGWKGTAETEWFTPPEWSVHAAFIGSLLMFLTLFAPYVNCNLRRIVRHPQLLGVVAWGIGHLLANGEIRSVLLFGGLTAWALIEIVLINRRDAAWQRPGPAPVSGDFKLLLTGAGFFMIFLFTHELLFGVNALPG